MGNKDLEKAKITDLHWKTWIMIVGLIVAIGLATNRARRLPVSPVFEEDKIPKEIKNRHEAQSRP